MATEVIHVDLRDIPDTIRLRDHVEGVFVVVSADERPISVLRLPRPVDGVLTSTMIRVHVDEAQLSPADQSRASRQPSRPPVSVVVPTHGRPDDLARCLPSLATARRDRFDEVIVVENGPTTRETASLAARFDVRYVQEAQPGANRARNAGVAVASHAVIAFVDDDVVVSDTWLDAICRPFAEAAVGCVTGLVLPLELETSAQEQFELYAGHRRDLQRRVYSLSVLRASAASIVGIGANMAFRRDVITSLGGFDPRFGPGTRTRTGDETDMFARVLDAGHTIVYSPEAFAWHRHRRSAREVRSCVFGYGVGVYSMLTKRVFEQRDLAAIITAGRWLVGPVVKAAGAKISRRPAPRWDVVLAETAGAAFGPLCFGYEAWRHRARPAGTAPVS